MNERRLRPSSTSQFDILTKLEQSNVLNVYEVDL